MTPRELEFLYATATAMASGACVVELGSWKGRSTVAICEGLKEGSATLYCVDNFLGSSGMAYRVDPGAVQREFESNTREYGFVKLLVSDTQSAAARFDDGSIDWIFIDADHSYQSVARDIETWAAKLRPGGILSGHDYTWFEVAIAVHRELCSVRVCQSIWHSTAGVRKRPLSKSLAAIRGVPPYLFYRGKYWWAVRPRNSS